MKLLTPFYGKHLEYGAKLIDRGGWQLPLVYTSVEEEYRRVRERAGFIDYSFMSSIVVSGKDAFGLLQKLLVNDLKKIHPGKAIYSAMTDETGKVVDNTIVYWLEENYFIVVGANKRTIDWVKKHTPGLNVCAVERNAALLPFQGPKSRDILQKVVDLKDFPYLSVREEKLNEIPIVLTRMGFTGELGYELFVNPEYAHALWDTLLEIGKEHQIGPFGLGASGILFREKGYLAGPDIYEGATPLEVGLAWTVAFDKVDFVGKEALLKIKKEGLKKKLMDFEVSNPKVIASAKDNLIKAGKIVGQVTTNGVYGYTVKKSIGRGWVEINYAREGEELELEHENNRVKIKMSRGRWYDPENRKVNS